MRQDNKYWLIRLAAGVGVFGLLLAVLLLHTHLTVGIGAALATSDPNLWGMVAGGVFGVLWDNFVAAGIAGYVVYGDWRDGIGGPPLRRHY